jgi:arsenite transporter
MKSSQRVKRLNLFERYLTLWVGLCMVAGLALGKGAPNLVQGLRGMEFGRGSHVNAPIAVLIWLMIVPMFAPSLAGCWSRCS